jgi:CRP/FNR family cyclic AMP-dependent transcriptional regulator
MLGYTIEFLEALPIFRGLSRRHLGYVLDVAPKAYFESGDNLIVKNDRGDTAYLILTGAARCLNFPGTPAASKKIVPGCLVGELAMLVETVHSLTVQANARIRALAFRRDAMKWVMQQDPVIAAQISDNLLVRLQSFSSDLRRLDNYLAHIEESAPEDYDIRALPEPPDAARALLPHPRAIPVQRLLQSR